jgi:hypothetical protein
MRAFAKALVLATCLVFVAAAVPAAEADSPASRRGTGCC